MWYKGISYISNYYKHFKMKFKKINHTYKDAA